jgi:hypothetical protein
MSALKKPLIVFIPDTRGVVISRFGHGNLKIGPNVYTYSRLPGSDQAPALGLNRDGAAGTCPGATAECQSICYARRPVQEHGAVYEMWARNSATEGVPAELPEGCTLLRLHVSGDFSSIAYIDGWRRLLVGNPQCTVWAYTRSWRVPSLLPALEELRALPNVQLFASMDHSTPEVPPAGWRRAWIDGDARAGDVLDAPAHSEHLPGTRNQRTFDGTPSLVCPEETKHTPNCETCRYCFDGKRNDVTFLKH